ncbi:3183_t:CDS:2 [Funneliformis geosporum]|uniref:3183_t:CDS:1 n=1 Tax=Funneliformis geosporum TaxID=1117311 RepID=A0A9W4SZM7_9GLOM|nr:3183_t:CDS:2 [Funneliformis geosporum]
MTDKLTFFITVIKSTNELVIQEGNLVNIRIPKHWQKPDSNVANPAFELVIKKHGVIYRGKLDPSGFNEKEEFYRCELFREETQGTS